MALELNQDQYNLLIKCSKNEDFTEWNNFIENYEGIIRLRYGKFSGLKFSGAKFYKSNDTLFDFYGADFSHSTLEGLNFNSACMLEANFEGAKIFACSFQDTELRNSNFRNAQISFGDFSCTDFIDSNLQNAEFIESNFFETNFSRANLEDTHFLGGGYNPIEGKKIRLNLCGTIFIGTKFNSGTYFGNYDVSIETDFRTIYFESANFSSGLRQTLRYCNRRHNWENWYADRNPLVVFFVKRFWAYSDYGQSVTSLIKSFCKVVLFFAILYFLFPSLIHGLEPLQPLRAVYFSIVTMTTLGYGDMYPSAKSWIAQCLVMLQVIYGYVLLGSLITVLSNLFTSDGPAQGLIKHPRKPNTMTATIKINK